MATDPVPDGPPPGTGSSLSHDEVTAAGLRQRFERVAGSRRAVTALLLTLGVLLVSGGAAAARIASPALVDRGSLVAQDSDVPSPAAPGAATAPAPGVVGAGPDRAAAAPVPVPGTLPPSGLAPPVRLRIPSIGVDSDLVGLRVQRDGTLAAPTTFSQAGWWRDGPTPGAPGAAILAGHVDSQSGPGVFLRLRDLLPGAGFTVARGDGSVGSFVVDAVKEYPKRDFPSGLVFDSGSTATVRLITCGGDFDRSTGHYLDNIVVFARPLGAGPAPGTAG